MGKMFLDRMNWRRLTENVVREKWEEAKTTEKEFMVNSPMITVLPRK